VTETLKARLTARVMATATAWAIEKSKARERLTSREMKTESEWARARAMVMTTEREWVRARMRKRVKARAKSRVACRDSRRPHTRTLHHSKLAVSRSHRHQLINAEPNERTGSGRAHRT
jgi:hypothetical protein